MKSDYDIALTLLVNFSLLSFLAVGGANSVVPELHRQAVDLHGWVEMSSGSPHPQTEHARAGALAATAAMVVPTCMLTYLVSRLFDRFKDATWRNVLQTALVSMSIGLIAASALIIARAADHDWKTLVITAASFAITYWTRISLLVPLAAAAVLGLAGVL
jgi:chromate transporter